MVKKIICFSILLIVLISCQSEQNKSGIAENTNPPPVKKEKNYVYIKANNKDTIFTNKAVLLDTSVHNLANEELNWKEKVKIKTLSKTLPGNEFKLKAFRKNKFSLDSGFYATEKRGIPEKPIDVIDTGRKITVIEPEQKKLLAPNFKDNAQYNIWCLGPDQGLASRNVYSIEKDDNGFMWFGTDNGLIRYDGVYAKTYKTENGLPENKIKVVKKDKKGNLWLGTEENGLIKFDGKIFHCFSLDSIAPKRAISDIEIDEKGDVWCTIIFGGLLHFDGKIFHSYREKQGIIVHRPTSSISIDKNGRKWITGYGQGLYTMTKNGLYCLNKSTNVEPSYIHSSLVDNKNRLFLGAYAKFYCMIDKDTISYFDIPDNKSDGFVAMVQDKQGNIWAAADAGGIYKLGDTSATHINFLQGISSDLINNLFADDIGKVWIGTDGGGVCCFDPESLRALNASRGSLINYYNKVIELKNHDYIMSTDQGINYFKDTSIIQLSNFDAKDARPGELAKNSMILAVNEKESIYAALLNSGVYRFDKTGNNFEGIRKWGLHINEMTIDILKNGDKLISGRDGHGIYKLTEDRIYNFARAQNYFFHNVISSAVDSKGVYWTGSEKQGLCMVKDNQATYFNTSNGLPDNTIQTIYEDKNQRIWAGTPKGLCYFENNKFTTVNFGDEEINQDIKGIIQDKQYRYWITTGNGLIVLTPKNKNSNNWSISNYYVNTLNKLDGFLNTSFTNRSIMINSKNELVVGSEGNLLFYPIDNFKISDSKPKVFLETIKIDGHLINYRNEIEFSENLKTRQAYDSISAFFNLPVNLILPSHISHLTFQYSSVYWQNPSKLKYVYFLEGLETAWNKSGNENIAEYRNLSYGKYKFHLKAFLANGIESEDFTYSFEIKRPWWHTWWARFTYLIILISGIGLFIRWRTFQLKKRQLELESEVTNATAEIRNQKDKIEEAHKNIKDSIAYAKRIQSAILPSERIVKEYLQQSFILYKPKDIVAGDFYWMEQKNDLILFAAADCTGHGVPGAMVSVVCNNGLNRSVREFDLSDPGQILDKTREIVIGEFEKSDEDVKDGMDISLCALNLKTKTLYWAGANNPIWIIRKDSNELIEIKGNKQPIGKYTKQVPFQTHQINLKEGDCFYIFTDGYQDQFGGDKGKKFKTSQLKELLLSIQNKSMDTQRQIIQTTIETWMGNLEQIDDMCFIGVRI